MKRIRPKKIVTDKSIHLKLRRRWRTWLPNMEAELTQLMGKREIFWKLQEIAKENPKILDPDAFFEWLCTNYVVAMSMGVRRFADRSKNVRSLWRMLYEILEHPGVIARHSHVSLYPNTSNSVNFERANLTFDNIAGVSRKHLLQRDVRKDLRELEDSSDRVRRFVNKRLAHLTAAGELRKIPKFNELDISLDNIDQIFCKYNLVLTALGLQTTCATKLFTWEKVFYDAWIPSNSNFRHGV